MRQTVTTLVDDIDGGKAEETVSFAVDGKYYEIDLGKKNAAKLRDLLQDYAGYARSVRSNGAGRGGGRRKPSSTFNEVDTKAVRAWAASNSIQVSARGRISADVLERYRAAGN
jgi:Lsr2